MTATIVQSRPETEEAHHRAVERVVSYMRANLAEPLDLDQLSKVAIMSKFHFLRVFEGITGTTPHHFMACLRIQRAKELLISSDETILQICLEVGYSSPSSFSTTFGLLVGVSPKEFREAGTRPDPLQFGNAVRRFVSTSEPIRGPSLTGVVDAPPVPRGFIFIGTFSRGVPAGTPDSGAILLAPGAFRMERPLMPEFHLLAVLVPFTFNLVGGIANFEVSLVASMRLGSEEFGGFALRLRLRPVKSTDPPVVLSLPTLRLLK